MDLLLDLLSFSWFNNRVVKDWSLEIGDWRLEIGVCLKLDQIDLTVFNIRIGKDF